LVRALLDANVLISAAIRPSGPPGRIIAALLTQSFDLILSPGIIEEVEIALALPKIRKYLREPQEAPRWLADIVALADLVQDTGNITGVCRDGR
jgi:putative PIN family toxin of toxin-antitoxin system